MGNLFSFLNGTNESNLFRACQVNDPTAAKEALNKLYPPGTQDVGSKLDALRDSQGKTALMVAAENGSLGVLDLLYTRGASVDARHAEYASTALHVAAAAGQREACLALLDRGADATALNARGLTPVDIARFRYHAHVVRAIEKRVSLFYGWLKWERSSLFQAGLGKVLGPSVKEALQKKFGGEWRESWVVVTKLTGKMSNLMMCPRCRGQFTDHRNPGMKITCPQCSTELHIPQTPVVSILELSIYSSPHDARPQFAFPLNLVSIESEFRVPEQRMNAVKIYVQRPGEAPSLKPGSDDVGHGVVALNGKDVLWGQSMLTMKASEVRSTKKVVFAVDDNPPSRQHLARFVQALKAQPVNAIEFAATSRNPDGTLGSGDLVQLAVGATSASVQAPRPAPSIWTCPVCTLENPSASRTCSACETPRDSSPLDVARARQSHERDPPRPSSGKDFPPAPSRATVVPPPPLGGDEAVAVAEESSYLVSEAPSHFICPLTGEIMEDPVVTVDGMSFERRAIEEHFRSNGPTSPLTMMPLDSMTLAPNIALSRAIREWKSSIPVASLAVT